MSKELILKEPGVYLLPKTGEMRVPGLIIATQSQVDAEELDQALEQVRHVATLPGIVGYSIAMPDMHWGYGFPIGGVAAMDAHEGVISPGGIGYDINCGVRLALLPFPFKELNAEKGKKLLDRIFARIPSGTGRGQGDHPLTESDYAALLKEGAAWSVARGYGLPEDLKQTESEGVIEGADPRLVSTDAKLRGRLQLGSIGSGNHFVEIGAVSQIFLPEKAAEWKIEEGQTYVLIHSGSRGFGHQVCQDFLTRFIQAGFAKGLPDSQLVAAPLHSSEGREYWAAMAAAANFAFNNRQQILHGVRLAFQDLFNLAPHEVRLIYDVCHNIGKMEHHRVEGKERLLCVHRKGATRAFVGQPVLVPGDMGRASYLLEGLGKGLTWCSCCHGAGRARSRIQSMKQWKGRDPIAYMRQKMDVQVVAHSYRTIAEEMPDAYKDVNVVIEAVEEAHLARKVAKLHPRLVLKG